MLVVGGWMLSWIGLSFRMACDSHAAIHWETATMETDVDRQKKVKDDMETKISFSKYKNKRWTT